MNKLITLILLMTGLSLSAQPVLQSTEMATPGHTYYYKHVGVFTAIDTTIQGANQTWDFSTVTTTTDPDYVISIINPAQTAFVDSFPGANYAYLEVDDSTYDYFNLNSSTYERLGSFEDTAGYNIYSDTQIEFTFPFQMGVSYTDSSMNSGSSFPGAYSINCIGYGTLNVPGHTYTNVLMAHVILDNFLVVEAYYWYSSDDGQPVFAYIPGDGFFIPEAAIYLNSVTTGVADANFAADVNINNPFSSVINMKLQTESAVALSYQLLNSMGQMIKSGVTEKSTFQNLNINTEGLSAGIYILSLIDIDNPENQRNIKLIKQ